MKNVLLITYLFPPRPAIGAQRPYGLAKHLSEYGWEATVLTAELPGSPPHGIKVIQTGYEDITDRVKSMVGFGRKESVHDQLGIVVSKNTSPSTLKSKLISRCKEILLFPDDKKGWLKYAVDVASKLMENERFDAIISTSPPVTSHLIALRLKKKFNVKWIADYRDPWSQRFVDNKTILMKYIERRLEIKTISFADILVSVTKPYVDKIKRLHPDKQIYCISNGFEGQSYHEDVPLLTDKFTITYTGYLYSGKRNPSMLLSAVKALIDEKVLDEKLVQIRFYGPEEGWLLDEINQLGLASIAKMHGVLPKREVYKVQRESQLLLLIRWDSKIDMGDCPAKIYEYMDAGRPIIATGGVGGIVEDLLEETNTGKFADNIENLKNILKGYYSEYIQKGYVSSRANNNIENYKYKNIAGKYAEILNRSINE